MSSTSPYPHGCSDNTDELRRVFIWRVHQLLKLGYDRLNAAQFQAAEERDISGELVHAMEQVCDDPKSEDWISHFDPHDDPPVHDSKRKGKRRCKVDIKVVSLQYRPRQRFSFEAKRLRNSRSVKAYLGREGLGCFLRGDYARNADAAGMLGYVQSGDLQDWASKIKTTLAKSPRRYYLRKINDWLQQDLKANIHHVYRSNHDRNRSLHPIDIYHTLLVFC